MAIFDNLFGAPPEYLTGLLGADETDKLRKQALTTGLVNSAIALIAQPRNQRYGSALPYIGKSLMAGQQAGQNVYANALQGLETQQKLAELKRQQEQRAAQEQLMGTLTDPRERLFAQLAPTEFVKGQLSTPKATGKLLTKEEQTQLGLPDVGRYQQKADGTVELVSGTAPKESSIPTSAQEYALAQKDPAFAKFLEGKKPAGVTVNLPPAEKTILEVDKDTLSGLTSNANAARSIATQTKTINSLIGNQQGSGVVKLSSDLQNYLGIKSPEANVNQAVSALANKAATEIRTPGSGSTSDLEFNAYRAAFPSLATSQPGRALMGQIAEANAKRMSKLADWARVQVQKGTFSYEGLAAYDDSLGSAVSDSIKKQVESLTGGKPATGFSIRRKQ